MHYLIKYFKYNPNVDSKNDLEELNKLLEVLLDQQLISLDGEPSLFGLPLNRMQLSPGQQYLLRMCIALHCNKVSDNSILLLDEPETHLHPDALLNLINELHTHFQLEQIWIATHSVALLSMFNASSIWCMIGETAKKLGSKSEGKNSGGLSFKILLELQCPLPVMSLLTNACGNHQQSPTNLVILR